MSVTITNSPREFASDSEDLIYKLATTDAVTSDFKFVVQVYVDGSEFGKFYLTPNPSNVSFFNLSGVCRDLCKVDQSTAGGTNIHEEVVVISKATTGVKSIEIRAGKYVSATETLNIDSETIYLIDGYRAYSEGLWGSWSDLVSSSNKNRVWLTERPSSNDVITVESNETEYGVVGFLNDSTFGSTATGIKYTLYNGGTTIGTHTFAFGAGTNSQLPTASTTAGKLQYFGLYPLNIVDALADQSVTGIDPIFSSNAWTHYTLQLVVTATSTVVSNALKVVRTVYNCKHTPIQLGWANKYGSWDYIMFDGRRQGSVETSNKSYWTETGTWASTTYTRNYYDAQRKTFGVMAIESYDLRAYMQSSNAYNLMRSLYQSDQIVANIDGVWTPVQLGGTSFNFHSEPISKMQEIAVKVTLSNPILC